jgi:hypothetical protein
VSGEMSFNKLCRCDFKRIGPKRFILWTIVYVTGNAADISHEQCWFLARDWLDAKEKSAVPDDKIIGLKEIPVKSVRRN